MIHVDRGRVEVPPALQSPAVERERHRAAEFFSPSAKPASQKFQERYEVNWTLLRETRSALEKLFQGKCAFCESPNSTVNPLDVGHFRPITEIMETLPNASVSSSSRPAYWWLAYEWENLYLICRACAERSRLTFPVAGKRATPGTRGAGLQSEQPLLLDPCIDQPEEYLTFTRGGTPGLVVDRGQPPSGAFRGQVTIETFDLNREELIHQRAAAMKALELAWARARQGGFKGLGAKSLRDALAPDRSYLGCLRELTLTRVRELAEAGRLQSPNRLVTLLSPVLPEIRDVAVSPVVEPGPVASGTRAPVPPEPRRPRRPRAAKPPATHGWYLRRVEIRNFKAIARLELDIPRGASSEKGWQTGWKVLLGENGTGKSTVLQAIVLAFMGERFLRSESIAPRTLLRRQGNGKVSASGFVKLFWVDRTAPTVMRFTRARCSFEGEAAPRELVLRAYGATRHLPRGRHKATAEARPKDVENLFDPFQPVCDAEGWLRGLKGTKAFGSAALSLKDLLGLTPRTRLSRQGGKVRVRLGGVDVTLDELSAGYQSVVVLATDIMAGVHGQAHDLRFATGIVLIDELDAHLHPRWKMQIVASLRRTFPGLQFIATTHEPLCLRGLKSGEIVVMRREGKRVQVISEVPSPEGLRVDQLLTSPLFGLHSTIDPTADRQFQRYYQLLGNPSLTAGEEEERRELSERLTEAGILGTPVVGQTRRSQLIYDAVDQYLAKEPILSLDDRKQFREETKQKVADIWKDVLVEVAGE